MDYAPIGSGYEIYSLWIEQSDSTVWTQEDYIAKDNNIKLIFTVN